MDNKEQAAYNLGILQQRFTQVLAAMLGYTGGTLLRLRCHERSVDDHDDVTPILAGEVIKCLRKYFNTVAEVIRIKGGETCDDADRGVALVDAVLQLKYGAELTAIFSKYVRGFKGKLAVNLLESAGPLIKNEFDNVNRVAVAILIQATQAKKLKVITNESVSEVITDQFRLIAKGLNEGIDNTLDMVSKRLDKIAASENKYFEQLIASGHSKDAAFGMVDKKFGDLITSELKTMEAIIE